MTTTRLSGGGGGERGSLTDGSIGSYGGVGGVVSGVVGGVVGGGVGCGGQQRALRPLGRCHGDREVGFGSGGDILPMVV